MEHKLLQDELEIARQNHLGLFLKDVDMHEAIANMLFRTFKTFPHVVVVHGETNEQWTLFQKTGDIPKRVESFANDIPTSINQLHVMHRAAVDHNATLDVMDNDAVITRSKQNAERMKQILTRRGLKLANVPLVAMLHGKLSDSLGDGFVKIYLSSNYQLHPETFMRNVYQEISEWMIGQGYFGEWKPTILGEHGVVETPRSLQFVYRDYLMLHAVLHDCLSVIHVEVKKNNDVHLHVYNPKTRIHDSVHRTSLHHYLPEAIEFAKEKTLIPVMTIVGINNAELRHELIPDTQTPETHADTQTPETHAD